MRTIDINPIYGYVGTPPPSTSLQSCGSHSSRLSLRRLHAIPERGGEGGRHILDRFSDDGFALDPSTNIYKRVNGSKKRNVNVLTSENECIICGLGIVKGARSQTKLEKHLTHLSYL
jgi:hypothetical protein